MSFAGGRDPTRGRAPKVIFEGGAPDANQATATAFNDERLQDPPNPYEAAMASSDASLLRDAMRAEVRALLENEAWEALELCEGRAVTKSRWVFDLKQNAAGNVTRYKARFFVCGYSQRAGVDYHEVWAPKRAECIVRPVLAAVSMRTWELHVMDVKAAVLYASMD